MSRLNEFVTTKELNLSTHEGVSITLPVNSFVMPIDERWIPKHILEAFRYYNQASEMFVYCRYGILVLPKDDVRQCN